MLSTDTIFVLRDRFDRRSQNEAKQANRTAGDTESAQRKGAPGDLQLRLAPLPKQTAASPSLPSAWERTPINRGQRPLVAEHIARVRPLMTAVGPDVGRSNDRGELSAMRGILVGVTLGASCWALVGSLLYRLVA